MEGPQHVPLAPPTPKSSFGVENGDYYSCYRHWSQNSGIVTILIHFTDCNTDWGLEGGENDSHDSWTCSKKDWTFVINSISYGCLNLHLISHFSFTVYMAIVFLLPSSFRVLQ